MKTLFILLIIMLLPACSFTTPSYQPSDANRKVLTRAGNTVSIVNEKTDIDTLDSIACRAAGSVSLASGVPFVTYVVDALKDELKASGKLDEHGKKLYVKITRITFSSRMGSTNWYIDATYRIDDQDFAVSTVYNDRSSFAAVAACNNVAQYFPRAVEQHLSQLYANPAFQVAVGFSGQTGNAQSDIREKLRQLNKLHQEGLISDKEFTNKKQQLLNAM